VKWSVFSYPDRKIAEQLGAVVAEITNGKTAFGANKILDALNKWCASNGACALSEQAKLLGLNKSTLFYWQTRTSDVAIQKVFELAVRNRFELLDLLEGNPPRQYAISDSSDAHITWKRRTFHWASKASIIVKIKAAQYREDCPSRALVAFEIGITPKTLTQWAPREAKVITKRYDEFITRRGTERWRNLCDEIDKAVRLVKSRGGKISIARIMPSFKTRGVFRSPKVARYAELKIAEAKRETAITTLIAMPKPI
jgi:hypothetical protein